MKPETLPPSLVLASTSRYRQQQLAQLGLPFDCVAPGIGESLQSGESAAAAAVRLAVAKAVAVARTRPGALIIGADQTLECGGQILGKPQTAARALVQLQALRDSGGVFHSGLALVDRSGACQALAVPVQVRLRPLSDQQLRFYIGREPALDCAGSFKVEGLGISLFAEVRSDDPSALVGLPLIALTRLLAAAGHDPLAPANLGTAP